MMYPVNRGKLRFSWQLQHVSDTRSCIFEKQPGMLWHPCSFGLLTLLQLGCHKDTSTELARARNCARGARSKGLLGILFQRGLKFNAHRWHGWQNRYNIPSCRRFYVIASLHGWRINERWQWHTDKGFEEGTCNLSCVASIISQRCVFWQLE